MLRYFYCNVRNNHLFLVHLLALLLPFLLLTGETSMACELPVCRLPAPARSINIPVSGWKPADSTSMESSCPQPGDFIHQIPLSQPKTTGRNYFNIYTNGPRGSGRYWDISLGVSTTQAGIPERGVCLQTTTLGWRSLQNFENKAIPWFEDLDHDGKAEFILWDSFSFEENPDLASNATYALVAWVYKLTGANRLQLDLPLSRNMAQRVAAAYRKPLKSTSMYIQTQRDIPAGILDKFGNAQCRLNMK